MSLQICLQFARKEHSFCYIFKQTHEQILESLFSFNRALIIFTLIIIMFTLFWQTLTQGSTVHLYPQTLLLASFQNLGAFFHRANRGFSELSCISAICCTVLDVSDRVLALTANQCSLETHSDSLHPPSKVITTVQNRVQHETLSGNK